ncbi:Presenilins-associated rhomboid-like protein, mitochondrial [Lamellibrachia satsuma]|nr:Presenilins-associated rhomboid-like protein, mitochondrial [Lamellibrachia satsuma]
MSLSAKVVLGITNRNCVYFVNRFGCSQGTGCHRFSTLANSHRKTVFLSCKSDLAARWGWHSIRRGLQPRKVARSSKRRLAPVPEVDAVATGGFSCLIRPLGFTVMVTGCSFGMAAIWQYESLRKVVQQANFNNKQQRVDHFGKAGGFRQQMNAWWNHMSPGRKVVASIIAANTAVFLMWRVQRWQHLMLKWFTSNPMSAAPCTSMLLSSFSHYSLMHLFVNMYVLWSFAPTITQLLGPEQFAAMYISAGVASSFTSYIHRAAIRSLVPSVGASGAIMAVLGAVCYYYPQAQLSVAFIGDIIPHSFSASSAMYGMIAFDTLGILLRWRFFDHAAHLGGIFFGIWYLAYGHQLIWKNREPFMKFWHDLRGRP